MKNVVLSKMKYMVLLWVCVLIAPVYSQKLAKKETTDARPNIIIVFTDDQGYGDLGHHGNPWIKTPNLDAFAEESLELTNFHVGTTCAPSRAGLLTGRNANRNNAWHTIAGCSILNEDEETMADVFAKNGYETAMFGKWHLGDNYPFRPHDRGFQKALYHGGGGVNQTPDYWNNTYFDDTYFRNGKPEKFKGYSTDVWFKEGMKFIAAKKKSPFFMYLALNAAHSPFNVPEQYAQMYNSAPLTNIQKRFYGMISNIDENFGKLVSYLKNESLFDNTIIIFTTDNGTAAGIKKDKNGNISGYNAGLRGTKGSHYDGGHKVPFFISWPNGNIEPGSTKSELVAHVDLLSTLTELSRIDYNPKKPLDGTSVAHILNGQKQSLDRMLVVDTQRNQWPEKGKNSCVMSTEWRLIDGKELYNIVDDPGQQHDVALDNPEIVKKMQNFYDAWWASIEPDIKHAEIPLGHSKANPALLTVHDLHTQDHIPWNQVQIRQGDAAPQGYYSIKIVEDGNYRFKLFRYPPESGLPLRAKAPEKAGTPFRDGLPHGKKIMAIKGKVVLGETQFDATTSAGETFVQLQHELKKGSYHLKCTFTTENGTEIPAYYTLIEKL